METAMDESTEGRNAEMDESPEGRDTSTDHQEPPAGGSPPPLQGRRLHRRTDDKMIAGVASGLAEYLNIDPVIVRVAFVILAVVGGVGIVAYGALWWLVPPTQEVSNAGEDAIRKLKRAPAWVAAALLVVGLLLLVDQLGPPHADVIWGLALIALGALLFWQTTGHRQAVPDGPGQPIPAPGSTPVAAAHPEPPAPYERTLPYETPMAYQARTATAPPPPYAPAAGPGAGGGFAEPWVQDRVGAVDRPRRAPRERSGLGWATVGTMLVVVGGAAVLDNAGAFDLSLAQYLALALAVLAAGLLVGTWVGRARWLALPAAVLVPFLLLASLVTVPFTGGWGDRSLVPASLARGQATYHMVAGRLRLDLTRLAAEAGGAGEAPLHVTATMVAGTVEVVVPRDVPVHVDARMGAGAMSVLGLYSDGLSLHRAAGQSSDRVALDLDVDVSFGRIVVFRAQS